MSSRVFAPRASIQRNKRPAERIYALSSTPTRLIRSPSPALVRSTPPPPPPPPPKRQGPSPCKNCGSTQTEEGDGNIVCKGCGLVLSNAPNYTSDITFEEGSNGRIQQQGQRVAEGQTHQKAFAPRGVGGGPGHEVTPAGDKAKTEAYSIVRRFAVVLRIDDREINMSRRIFEMAYNRGFVRGRTIDSVAIVALYVATRRAKDRNPVYDLMLIDFAEHAKMNVFDLGKMMQDLIKTLYLNADGTMSKEDHFYLQAHGAEVLISKFVSHLDFGSDAEKIKTDATRILQRMKRDWIHHGRRPSGVCGAAVILAARMNNYRRTLREVVLVAKVTEVTVSKRLEEFKETKVSTLSVNDFRDDGILGSMSEMDPPAYYRALQPPKVKGKRGRRRKGAPETAAEIEGLDTQGPPDTESSGETTDGQPPSKRRRIDADGFAVPDVPTRPTQSLQLSPDNIDPQLRQQRSMSESEPVRRGPGRAKGSKNWVAPPPTPEELAHEEELTSSMQAALDDNQDLEATTQLPTPSATQKSNPASQAGDPDEQDQDLPNLPLRVDPKECDPKKGPPGPAVNTNAGNTGTISMNATISESEFDSDPEVSSCLLSEPERVLKEQIWVTENAEWLRQDHAKRIRRELKDRHLREQGIDPDELRKNKKGDMKKRKDGARRSGRVGDVGYLKDDFHKKTTEEAAMEPSEGGRRASAASINVKAMMKQRGTYSRRINYDNLVKAYDYPVGSSTSPSRSPSVDRDSREASVISVSSTGTTSTAAHDSIGPFFIGGPPRKKRRPPSSARTIRARKADANREEVRSPNAEEATEPEQDSQQEPSRQRSGTAASPEPAPAHSSPAKDDADVDVAGVSSSASPLSSTYTPVGVGTPGSSGTAPTRIDRSMYGSLGKVGVDASKSTEVEDEDENGDEDEDGDDEDRDDEDGDDEDGDDEEDEDEDDVENEEDADDDLDNAFAGKYQERPVWEGEDEVVEE